MAKIYVASSGRNKYYPKVISILREHGHEVYDFRDPKRKTAFLWKELSEDYENWSRQDYLNALTTDKGLAAFHSDFEAMQWADTFVQVMPSGISASLEMGWAVGQDKHTFVYLPTDDFEPELMHLLCDHMVFEMSLLCGALNQHQQHNNHHKSE